MNIKQVNTRGFTLLELMLTIAIISILAAVSYGSYQRYVVKANITDLVLRIDAIRTAFAVLEAEEGVIPRFTDLHTPGVIPPELSRLGVSDDILQYRNIEMFFNEDVFRASPYVLIMDTKRDVNDAILIALSESLPHGQFAWVAEPYIGIIPVIGTMNVLSNKQLAPIASPAPAPAPIPISSSKFNIVPNP